MAESTVQRPGLGAVVRALLPQRGARWTSEAIALTTVVGALTVIGLVMSFSASFVDAAETGDPFGIFVRQLLWAAVGVPVFLIAANLDHSVWRRLSWVLMAGALGGLVAVLTGLGITEGGSTRWLALGPLVVQPSEIAKLATVLWLADVFTRKRAQGIDPSTDPRHAFLPAVPLLVVLSVLVMAQPDLGTTLVLGLIVGLVLLVEGAPLRHMGTLVVAGGTFALVAAVAAPYRFARIAGWLDPEADPLGNGYQLLQSMYALGSGGWFGLGLGSSRGKWNFVPNPETDFIFAIIGEELGVVGAVLVLALFAAIVVLGLRVARTTRDPFGRTVAFVVTGWITGQALVNVAAVTGLLPITGVTLPLVSVGGSSLVSTLLALGILVAVARAQARPHRKVAR